MATLSVTTSGTSPTQQIVIQDSDWDGVTAKGNTYTLYQDAPHTNATLHLGVGGLCDWKHGAYSVGTSLSSYDGSNGEGGLWNWDNGDDLATAATTAFGLADANNTVCQVAHLEGTTPAAGVHNSFWGVWGNGVHVVTKRTASGYTAYPAVALLSSAFSASGANPSATQPQEHFSGPHVGVVAAIYQNSSPEVSLNNGYALGNGLYEYYGNAAAYPAGYTQNTLLVVSGYDNVITATVRDAMAEDYRLHGGANALAVGTGTALASVTDLYGSAGVALTNGYDPQYGAWRVSASSNHVNVGGVASAWGIDGTTVTGRFSPRFILHSWTGGSTPTVRYNGVTLTKGQDYECYADTTNSLLYLCLLFDVGAGGVRGSTNVAAGATVGELDISAGGGGTSATRDARSRIGIAALSARDVSSLLRLRANAVRDAALRVRLIAGGLRDAQMRLRLLAAGYRDAQARVRIGISQVRDAQARVRMAARATRDAAARLPVRANALRDAQARVRLLSAKAADAQARVALQGRSIRDAQARVRAVARGLRDGAIRLRLMAGAVRDGGTRVNVNVSAPSFPRTMSWFGLVPGSYGTQQAQALSRYDVVIGASYKASNGVAPLKALAPATKVPFYIASEEYNPYPATQQDDLGGYYHVYDPPANGGTYAGWFVFTTQLASLGASNPLVYVSATSTAVAATGSQSFTLTATGGTALTDVANGDTLYFDTGGTVETVTLTAWNGGTGVGTATFAHAHAAGAVVKKSPATFTVDSTGNAAKFTSSFGGVSLSPTNWIWVRVDDESIPVQGISGTTFTIKADASGVPIRGGIGTTAKTHAASAPIKQHGGTLVYNSVTLNVSSQCPVAPGTAADPAVQNKTWAQWLASFVGSEVQSAGFDGVFFDVVNTTYSGMNASAIDANNDGAADQGNGPSGVGTWWRDGQQALYTQTRATLDAIGPGLTIVGNGWRYTGGQGWGYESAPHYGNRYSNAQQPFSYDYIFWPYLSQSTDAALMNGANPTSVINAGAFNAPNLSGQPPFSYAEMRCALALALMGNGYFSLDFGSHAHGNPWALDEFDGGQGSSLAAALTASTANTTVQVASGTGSRFQAGQVVYVAIDGEPASSTAVLSDSQQLNDEPMYVSSVAGDTLTVVRNSVDGTVNSGPKLGAHWAGQKVLTAAQMAAGKNWLGPATGPAQVLGWSNAGATGVSVDAATWAHGQFDAWTGSAFTGWALTTGNGAAATLGVETSPSILRQGGGTQAAKVTVTTPTYGSGYNVKLATSAATTLARPAAGSAPLWYTARVWMKTDQTGGKDADIRVYNATGNQTRAQQRFTLFPDWAPYCISWREEATFAGTCAGPLSPGAQTLTLSANAGSYLTDLMVGESLTIDVGGTPENVTVTAIPATGQVTVTLTGSHAGSTVSVASATETASFCVDAAYDTGTIWVDTVQLLDGNINLFRRDFQNGTAIVNATGQTVTVPLGATFTTLNGTQDAAHNSNAAVTSVTLAHQDAYLLRAGNQAPVYRDAGARLLLRAQAARDTALRVALRAAGLRDADLRLRLRSWATRDAALRLRLLGSGYRDAQARLRAMAVSSRDAALRARVAVASGRDASARVALKAQGYRDAALRVVVHATGQAYRDAQGRLLVAARGSRDAALRLALATRSYRGAQARLRLSSASGRDATLRVPVRSIGGAYSDAGLRLALRAAALRDAAARVRLSAARLGDAALRARVAAASRADAQARVRVVSSGGGLTLVRRSYSLATSTQTAAATDAKPPVSFLGVYEKNVTFDCDVSATVPAGESLTSVSAVVQQVGPVSSTPVDVTATLLTFGPTHSGSVVSWVVGNANAVAGATYTVKLQLTLSTGQVVQADMPGVLGVV